MTCGLGVVSFGLRSITFRCHFWGQSPDKFVSVTRDESVVDKFGVSFSLGGISGYQTGDSESEILMHCLLG